MFRHEWFFLGGEGWDFSFSLHKRNFKSQNHDADFLILCSQTRQAQAPGAAARREAKHKTHRTAGAANRRKRDKRQLSKG